GQTGELSGAVAGLGASGFEAREVEQGVDQFQQAQCVALNHGKLLGFVAREITGRLTQKLLERAEHQGERGAKFMADIAEEKSLGAVDRSQRIIALPLQLKGSRRVDRPPWCRRRDSSGPSACEGLPLRTRLRQLRPGLGA